MPATRRPSPGSSAPGLHDLSPCAVAPLPVCHRKSSRRRRPTLAGPPYSSLPIPAAPARPPPVLHRATVGRRRLTAGCSTRLLLTRSRGQRTRLNSARASPAQIELPQILPCSDANPLGAGFHIDVVDSDLWPASLSFSSEPVPGHKCLDSFQEHEEEVHDSDDEIDDMRNRKKLFYKLDRGSKEFEERNLPLRRRWKRDKPNTKNPSEDKKVEPSKSPPLKVPKLKAKPVERKEDTVEVKRDRVPTFNQMTGPYHYPFCLDIHVSKGSVRACFVHRVTSRVVSVAHSISKDMKFDLGSRKGIKACVAVGALLAKRAIEDDIHNAIYTPRKGDKIEGKIEVVLRGIVENGVDVKVKLKQRKLT